MKRLILVFFLCILMAPVINATAVEQYLSADYHGETYVVFYLPDLTEGDGVWACDGFDYDIVNVTVTPHPVGRMMPGSVPKYVYQLKIEGLSAGFAFVTVDLTSKDHLAWRYNFFVEVDDALNVIIRYAELQRGEGDITDVTIDYGHSEHFTQEQMEKAVQVILNDFKSWTGYVLHDITYKSDAESKSRYERYALSYNQKDIQGRAYVDGIYFTSSFYTNMADNALTGFSSNSEQTGYGWTLLLTVDGEWEIISSGY